MPNEKRIGRQTPTVWITLPYKNTLGSDAIDAYQRTGKMAFPWETFQINAILAVDDEGQYIHRRYGFSVPRRNGKNEIAVMRELFALEHGEKVLHTAHLTATSSAASARLARELDKMGYVEVSRKKKGEDYSKAYSYRKQFGMEVITLLMDGGGSVSFRTRTSKGGLGENYDVLIIDEAQEYLKEQENTLKFLVSDSKNRQILMFGTPPTAISNGTVFKQFRSDVIDDKLKHCGWAEWSVPQQVDINNRDWWYEANPSLGLVFGEDAIEDEMTDDVLDFNIQRLGLWLMYNLASAITETDWKKTELKKMPALKGRMHIGIKYGTNGNNVALSIACKTADDKVFVSAYDMKSVREGNEWIVTYLSMLKSIGQVVVDGKGNDKLLEKRMREMRMKKPLIPSGSDFCLANTQFEQAVYNDGIAHLPQPALDLAVTNCEKKKYGRGSFIFVSNVETIDLCIMESAILAYWSCVNAKEGKGQRVGY